MESFLLRSTFCLTLFSRCSQGLSSVMALGLRCFRLVHPAFCSSLAALTRPVSEITLKAVSGRQNIHGQFMASLAVPTRLYATKKAKGRYVWPPHPFLIFSPWIIIAGRISEMYWIFLLGTWGHGVKYNCLA